jgi:RNA polymerase sigma-70 factor (ECF subfamily)
MKKLSTCTDAYLVQLYKTEQNPEFVGELYRRYASAVLGLSYKYLRDVEKAKDAKSEIFVIILEKLKTHEVTYFRSWLFMVCKHYLLRTKSKRSFGEMIHLEKIPEKYMENLADTPLNVCEYKNTLLLKAVDTLNEPQRKCIELFYFRQKPYVEVASITGFEMNKVKSCIQNGKRNLKFYIEDKLPSMLND